ncbi:hypothetical protein FIBSPDRAFT_957817 [Athelia psychrophila]|uniref:Retrotransposon gag domain-containing protein n=1 Tax=Athelia psychrophila TaxID=1759441 RepID=A0A166FFF2_9AGAM|nr:hypothetical protein FIBSPDRAFT_957817 [Fibularhizoctonia sp. CBS 109695]
MEDETAPPANPGPPPHAPQLFVPVEGWSTDTIAVAQQVYEQIFAQVNKNLVDAFGEEVQRLRDNHAALEAAFNELNVEYAKEFAAQVQRTIGGIRARTSSGSSGKFETFSSDATKILWSQGFLTGTAALWSSNITHSLSFDPARYNFDTWIASFRAMFCSRDRAADARKALHSLSMGNRSISAYCNEAKAIILDLAPGDRNSDLVLDRFKAGLSVVAATRLLNMQPKYTTIDQALGYLLANEQDFIELDRRLAASHRATPPARPFVAAPAAAPKVPFQFSRAPAPGPTPHSFQRPPPARDPMAMDLDAARQRSASANTRCRDCSEFGHATCGYTKARARQAWASSAASSSHSPSSSSSWATTSASVSASGSSAPPSPASTTQSDFVGANLV